MVEMEESFKGTNSRSNDFDLFNFQDVMKKYRIKLLFPYRKKAM